MAMQPTFYNVVVVQPSCSIIGNNKGDARIWRIDTLVKKVRNDEPSLVHLVKVISPETLHLFAAKVVAYHKPMPKLKVSLSYSPPGPSEALPIHDSARTLGHARPPLAPRAVLARLLCDRLWIYIRGMSRIQVSPEIHCGKPCVAGTRIPVQAVLELVRDGISAETIIRDYYPDLKPEDIKACVRYAIDIVGSEDLHVSAVA